MTRKQVAYDEKAIQTLDALSHIRLRTGMYIGRLGDGSNPADGIYVMLKEVIDNSIDEFIMGEGKKIEINRDGKTVEVRDYGRGIPLGKVVECVSQINTGGKYNDDVFQFSVGLNGVGTKAVNALSSDFEVKSVRDGKFKQANFVRGKLTKEKGGKSSEPNGTYIRFTPDEEIFGEYEFEEPFIEHRLRYYAYLNRGLRLSYSAPPRKETFQSKAGLKDLLLDELGDGAHAVQPVGLLDLGVVVGGAVDVVGVADPLGVLDELDPGHVETLARHQRQVGPDQRVCRTDVVCEGELATPSDRAERVTGFRGLGALHRRAQLEAVLGAAPDGVQELPADDLDAGDVGLAGPDVLLQE